jgi:hypothetical protein
MGQVTCVTNQSRYVNKAHFDAGSDFAVHLICLAEILFYYGKIRLMSYALTIAKLINARPSQVEATILLLDEGNTVPFIARYRKEMTGTLDD